MASQGPGNTKNMLTTVASVAASAMLIRTIINDFVPEELLNSYYSAMTNLQRRLSPHFTIVIDEFRGFSRNQVFDAVETYLGIKVVSSAQRVKVGKAENEKNMAVAMDTDEEVTDDFDGFQVNWRLICSEIKSSAPSNDGHRLRDLNASLRSQVRSYELKFHKRYKEKVITSYLPHVLATADAIVEKGKAIKLHTAQYDDWNSNIINLDHPMTFETLAMDSDLKKMVLEDLDNFKRGKEFYRRIGKAWKRGYLLYGPPGTGKTSLIACIASYLNYDIYDLDLSEVDCNSCLRSLLLGMSSRSILVIEDIDCTIKLENREDDQDADNREKRKKVTLSGLLNFIDGLWSSCGDERIFIFTTNHKERLDPALLRPGRMDMHILMSYCTFSVFKQLAFNYLRLTDHQIFDKIEELLREAKATPAEVAGELMKNYNDSSRSLHGLVEFLEKKKEDQGKVQSSEIMNSKE